MAKTTRTLKLEYPTLLSKEECVKRLLYLIEKGERNSKEARGLAVRIIVLAMLENPERFGGLTPSHLAIATNSN